MHGPLDCQITCRCFVLCFCFVFCWPCISIHPCNENQLDALFIFSLFRQSTSTCFGHICSPSSGGILYIDIFVNCNCVDTRWQQYSTHLHTQNTQNNTINLGRVQAVPRLCELYPGICLTTEEKARENLSQGSRRVPVVATRTEYTEQNIHSNKNKE
jgi:hypothetical protein